MNNIGIIIIYMEVSKSKLNLAGQGYFREQPNTLYMISNYYEYHTFNKK